MSHDWNAESLNQRIRNEASRLGITVERLRNRIAFQRILARLALRSEWLLKGGFCLEVRLGLNARATRDLDLLRLDQSSISALDLQDQLDEALETDLSDGFSFRVGKPKAVRVEEAEAGAWRVTVEVRYDEQQFGISTIDVVKRSPELPADALQLGIEATLVGSSFEIQAIDPHRHAAEKYHAYIRSYAWNRPSSRVKDLVDLVLLCDSGFLNALGLGNALRQVFKERETALPDELPPPPADWADTYPQLARETSASAESSSAAWRIAANWYSQALHDHDDHDDTNDRENTK